MSRKFGPKEKGSKERGKSRFSVISKLHGLVQLLTSEL